MSDRTAAKAPTQAESDAPDGETGDELSALDATLPDGPAGSQPGSDAGLDDDDGRLDLSAMVLHSSLARPGSETADASATLDSTTRLPVGRRATYDAARPGASRGLVVLGTLLGFGVGLTAGWALFAGGVPVPDATRLVPEAVALASAGDAVQASTAPATGPAPSPAAVAEPDDDTAGTPQSPPAEPSALSESGPEHAVPTPVPAQPATQAASGTAAASGAAARPTPAHSPPREAQPAAAPGASVAPETELQPKAPSSALAAKAQPPKPAPEAPTADAEPRTVDDLLDEALAASPGLPAPAAPAQALPATPGPADVTEAIRVLIPAIRGCAGGTRGVAVVSLVVAGSGRVSSARVSGAPFEGTGAGSCMEGVVRKARFPHFSRPSFRVQLPLKLQ